jgi:hypothetical protein
MSRRLPPSQRPERQGNAGPGQVLIVGQPYHPARRHWPEGADYNFRADGHTLRIFLSGARPEEVASVREGRIEFGLLLDLPELFVISRYFNPRDPDKMVMAFDCSYQIHRVALEDRTPPPAFEEVNPKLRALVMVILCEATTGVILALRYLTYSPEFTRVLHRAIADQLALPYDRITHERAAVAKVQAMDTFQLWKACAVHCTGGERI